MKGLRKKMFYQGDNDWIKRNYFMQKNSKKIDFSVTDVLTIHG